MHARKLKLFIAMAFAAAGIQAAEMSVQIQTGQLRETPSYLGKALSTVGYADRVTIITRQGPWLQVTSPAGKTGWIHESALTRDKIVLKAGADDVQRTASGEEIALAGKGFNSQVEADFKDKNKEIDFTWIDRMEKINVKQAEMNEFMAEGGLQ